MKGPLSIVLFAVFLCLGCMSEDRRPQPLATTQTTVTTSSSSTSTSTTTSTTTTATTTPTLPAYKVACSSSGECGGPVDERRCHQGNVYINRITPICQSPGTPYATCVNKTALAPSPAEVCTTKTCQNGECVMI